MKKSISLMILVTMSASATAQDNPVGNVLIELNKAKTAWVLEKIGRGEKKVEPDTRRQKRLKECIKPKNLIDDDVKKCMDGTIKKDW